jgi:AcrR family transcriptional regulator
MVSEAKDTEYKILITACQLFAERGFDKVTHREIAKTSGVNSALINYYFRSKENLFKKVLDHCFKLTEEKYAMPVEDEVETLEEIKLIVRARLLPVFDDGPAGWCPRIVVHEMSVSSNNVKQIKPYHLRIRNRLKTLVAIFLKEDEGSLLVRTSVFNIISQWVMMNKGRYKGRGLFSDGGVAPEDVETVINHITEFITGGLEHLKKNKICTKRIKT